MLGMNAGEVAALAVQAVVVVCLLAATYNGALAWPTDRHLALFVSVYEVPVTPTNRHLLARYIWWSRLWRIGGGVTALVATRIVEAVSDVSLDPVVALASGYTLGSVIGEALRPRPPQVEARHASLDVRRITDYVRPWLLVAVGVGALTAIGSLVRFQHIYGLERPATYTPWPNTPTPAIAAVVVAATLAGAILALVSGHVLARRPQPVDVPEVEAVHHAIRSAAIVSLTGCALMLSGLATESVAMHVSQLSGGLDLWFREFNGFAHIVGFGATFTGLMLSLRSIPRFAPFWRRLPAVPPEPA